MKSEPKAFASLSSGLLARKGAARPAMRPQGFNQASGSLDDLGWNDMGFEPPKPSSTPLRELHAAEDAATAIRVPFAGLTPLDSPVHSQQAEIAERLSADAEEPEVLQDEPAEMALPVPADPEPEIAEVADVEEPPLVQQPAARILKTFEPAPEMAPEPVLAREAEPEPTPVAVAVVSASVPRRTSKARSAPGSNAKAAFTLRLDPDRHLKLRLACAIGGRSAQQLVTDALDQLLATMPELNAMADNAKRKGS